MLLFVALFVWKIQWKKGKHLLLKKIDAKKSDDETA
jgi:hypothetical protein